MFIIRISKPILVEDLCYNFSTSNDPTQIDFPTQINNCYCHSPALLDYLFLLNLFFALQYLSVYWEIQIMYFFSFQWIFFRFKIRCTTSPYNTWLHIYTYDYSRVDWDGLHAHLRYVLNLVLLRLRLNFVFECRFELI